MKVLDFVPYKAKSLLINDLAKFEGRLIISKPRRTKLGDFKWRSTDPLPTISINNDLNEYAFLVTLLHELAHYFTWKSYGTTVKPHGKEWKNSFSALLTPYLRNSIFPQEVHLALTTYAKNPKASSCSDTRLFMALNSPGVDSNLTFVSQLKQGSVFFYNKKEFSVVEKKTKRILCIHSKSKRKFLFQPIAKVELITSP